MKQDTSCDGAAMAAAALPDEVEPTYAPFLLALGITMTFWGIATSPIMSVAGLMVFACAMWLWIRDIARGWRHSDER